MEIDKQFDRQAREGVADGDPGRAVYIADGSTTANRKQNWTYKQHVTYKDSKGELEWRKTYAELGVPKS